VPNGLHDSTGYAYTMHGVDTQVAADAQSNCHSMVSVGREHCHHQSTLEHTWDQFSGIERYYSA